MNRSTTALFFVALLFFVACSKTDEESGSPENCEPGFLFDANTKQCVEWMDDDGDEQIGNDTVDISTRTDRIESLPPDYESTRPMSAAEQQSLPIYSAAEDPSLVGVNIGMSIQSASLALGAQGFTRRGGDRMQYEKGDQWVRLDPEYYYRCNGNKQELFAKVVKRVTLHEVGPMIFRESDSETVDMNLFNAEMSKIGRSYIGNAQYYPGFRSIVWCQKDEANRCSAPVISMGETQKNTDGSYKALLILEPTDYFNERRSTEIDGQLVALDPDCRST